MSEKVKNKSNIWKYMRSMMLIVLLVLIWNSEMNYNNTALAAELTLENPRIMQAVGMESGQVVTWDCVWFGNYPQAEVIPTVEYTALDESILYEGDIIVSDSLYSTLEKALGWDEHNEIILEGTKYRRIKKDDATDSDILDDSSMLYYHWLDSTSYHYFKYEPIKWRILDIVDNQAFLLSDVVLDTQKYHSVLQNVSWEKSTIRSWLNGYGTENNSQSISYKEKSFMGSAFTNEEQKAITTSIVENRGNTTWGVAGGNDTLDKIFLLADFELFNNRYGFVEREYDEAHYCKSSAYAKAMGNQSEIFTLTDEAWCYWWLRTPGWDEQEALRVWVNISEAGGPDVNRGRYGVRAALKLDLSFSNTYSLAGTVSSDGTVDEMGTITCDVLFDSNGGRCSTESMNVIYGDAYGTLPIPTRTGYTFTGWYTSETGGMQITSSTVVTTDLNHILYAHWMPNTYIVSFNANGGNCDIVNMSVTYGGVYGGLPTPTRTGYTFTGWYTGVSGGSQITSSTTVSLKNNQILYAHWIENIQSQQNLTENRPANTNAPSTGSGTVTEAELNAIAKANYKMTAVSSNVSVKSAAGVTEADRYIALGNIKFGKKSFTLKLNTNSIKKLSYKSSNKKVATISAKGAVKIKGIGKTTITVTATVSSTGKKITKKYALTVNPDKTVIKTVKSTGAGKIQLSWKKNKSGAGYQIYCSQSKNFKKGTKSYNLSGNTGTAAAITNLISKAKYYVKLRSYKVVSGKTYYGAWSKVKAVKVR